MNQTPFPTNTRNFIPLIAPIPQISSYAAPSPFNLAIKTALKQDTFSNPATMAFKNLITQCAHKSEETDLKNKIDLPELEVAKPQIIPVKKPQEVEIKKIPLDILPTIKPSSETKVESEETKKANPLLQLFTQLIATDAPKVQEPIKKPADGKKTTTVTLRQAVQQKAKITPDPSVKKSDVKPKEVTAAPQKIEEKSSTVPKIVEEKAVQKIGKILSGRIHYSIDELCKARSFLLSNVKPDAYIMKDAINEIYWLVVNPRIRHTYEPSANAWISSKERLSKFTGEEAKFEIFKIKLQSSVNKLAAINFNDINAEINRLSFESEKYFEFFINCVFKSIVLNHAWILNFAKVYISVYNTQASKNTAIADPYKKLLIEKLKEHTVVSDDWISKHKELKESLKTMSEDDGDIRSEEILVFEDKKRKEVIGCALMLANLFKLSFIEKSEIAPFVRSFFGFKHDLEIEILCSFVSMTYLLPQSKSEPIYEELFALLTKQLEVCTYRIKFMIKDLLDLRRTSSITVEDVTASTQRLNRFNDQQFTTVPQRGKASSQSVDKDDQKNAATNFSFYTPKSSSKNTPNASSQGQKSTDYGLGSSSFTKSFNYKGNHASSDSKNISVATNKFGPLSSLTGADAGVPSTSNGGPKKDFKKPSFSAAKSLSDKQQPASNPPKKYEESKSSDVPADKPSSVATSNEIKELLIPLLIEYIQSFNIEEVSSRLKLYEFSYHMQIFVKNAFDYLSEKISFEHEYFGYLIYQLHSESRVTMADFSLGFEEFLPSVPELEIDFPMIWSFVSRSIGFLVCSSLYPISAYYSSLQKAKIDNPKKHIFELLEQLLHSTSQLTVQSIWLKFKNSFKDFFGGVIDQTEMVKYSFLEDKKLKDKYLFSFDSIMNANENGVQLKNKLAALKIEQREINIIEFARLIHYCCPPGSNSAILTYMKSTIVAFDVVFSIEMSSPALTQKFFSYFEQPMNLVNNKPALFLENFVFSLVTFSNVDKDFLTSKTLPFIVQAPVLKNKDVKGNLKNGK